MTILSRLWNVLVHRIQGFNCDLLCGGGGGGGGVCGFRLLRGAHVYAKPTEYFICSQTVKYIKLRESVMINNMLIKIILDVGRVESKKINKILLDLLKIFYK